MGEGVRQGWSETEICCGMDPWSARLADRPDKRCLVLKMLAEMPECLGTGVVAGEQGPGVQARLVQYLELMVQTAGVG